VVFGTAMGAVQSLVSGVCVAITGRTEALLKVRKPVAAKRIESAGGSALGARRQVPVALPRAQAEFTQRTRKYAAADPT